MTERRRAGAVVLAAGQGRRFGGPKALAVLDGRVLLQHVLDGAAAAGLGPIVVVLGAEASAVEAAIEWRAERRVVNPRPQDGLSGSVRRGLAALADGGEPPERAVVLLADQPRLSLEQLERLLAAPRDPIRPIVVPIYADGRPGNPVLLEREAWPLARRLRGDRGMVQLFLDRPELVRRVNLPGLNPDVDTPPDLDALRQRRST